MKRHARYALFLLPLFLSCHLLFPGLGAKKCAELPQDSNGNPLGICQDGTEVLERCGDDGELVFIEDCAALDPALLCNESAAECSLCGNDNVDPGEDCDEGRSCESGDPCGANVCADGSRCVVRASDDCNVFCKFEIILTCGNGDLDSAEGEICDDGGNEFGDGCRGDCRGLEACGDGLLDLATVLPEQCDEGDILEGDGCSSTCQTERCGDGSINNNGLEVCDDGNTNNGDGCRADCQGAETCGDGLLDGGEVCDDGNTIAGDGCRADCRGDEECGDNFLDPAAGEQCDDGAITEGDGCSSTCQTERCGDGSINNNGLEVCDDGNTNNGDGCRADCQGVETCGDNQVDTVNGEECDDGNSDNTDLCLNNCTINGLACQNPQPTETSCDNNDNDCNGQIDEGCDDDNDGFCDVGIPKEAGTAVTLCPNTPAQDVVGNDCNDNNAATNPDATELCDGADNDCDAASDEGCDDDNDDFCDSGLFVVNAAAAGCSLSTNNAQGNDCNDANAGISPADAERCGSSTDENCTAGDNDGCDDDNDDFCDSTLFVVNANTAGCALSTNNVQGNDCNDSNSIISAGATERCGSGVDEDCTGGDNNGCDDDNDDFCDSTLFVVNANTAGCTSSTANAQGNDCNDANAGISPADAERCGSSTDENCTAGDNDGCDDDNDDFCDSTLFVVNANTAGCALSTNNVQGNDCADNNAAISAGAAERCGSGVDENCTGGDNNGCDDDNDDFCDSTLFVVNATTAGCALSTSNAQGNDCNDTTNTISPVDTERCGSGVDENCTGGDNDGCDDDNDNFCDSTLFVVNAATAGCPSSTANAQGNDCADNDVNRFPGQHELCDGIDQDCDGLSDLSTDANPDPNTDETCGAILCLNLGGVIDCACNADAQCELNGGDRCEVSSGRCDCKGGGGSNFGVRGQACGGSDVVVDVCSINSDCPVGKNCTGGTSPNKFCQ